MPCYDPRSADEEKHAREGMVAACTLIKWLLNDLGCSLGSGLWIDSKGNERLGCACPACGGDGYVRT